MSEYQLNDELSNEDRGCYTQSTVQDDCQSNQSHQEAFHFSNSDGASEKALSKSSEISSAANSMSIGVCSILT